jgi:hypothetical protein
MPGGGSIDPQPGVGQVTSKWRAKILRSCFSDVVLIASERGKSFALSGFLGDFMA